MIQIEVTPNPDSLKFLSENRISASGTEEFQKGQKNEVTYSFRKRITKFQRCRVGFIIR
jgi:hypothetical protein